MDGDRTWFLRPSTQTVVVTVALLLSSLLVYAFPRSLPAFLLFQASLLILYHARITRPLKIGFAVSALGLLLPILGSINGYYLEVAIQVGIFVA